MTIKNLFPTVRPALDLNFAQTKRLDPRITFSRASTGTYFDANGVLQSAPADVARFDHNPETGESLGLLIEKSATNLFFYSEDFTTGWASSRSTQTANTTTAPDGTLTADSCVVTGTGFNGSLSQNKTLTAGTTYALSFFLKYKGFQYVRVAFSVNNTDFSSFDLLNGSIAYTGSNTVPYIQALPNGWYRCLIVFTPATTSTYGPHLFPTDAPSSTYTTASGTDGVYVWGAQLEASPYPTSYIPTVASTVTRAADVCTVTNSNIYDTDSFTIINQPFGASTNDGSELTLFDGPEPIKRATVYSTDLSQTNVNAAAGKDDEFWRWRVLGTSFALPAFLTDGQVTVDWGDGTVETLTTAEHTFSNGGGYHDIGFRLDSGTYFRPNINNGSHDTKVVALGPAPESMKLNALRAFFGCSNLEAFDATVDATGGTDFTSAWQSCTSLTSFPLIDTSSGTNFFNTWAICTSLTSFPLIDTSSGTTFVSAWNGCSSLTSFPLINTASGTNFDRAWNGCSSLTSFPLIDTAAGTNFNAAWNGCSSLTSFPLINTAAGTNFNYAWQGCTSLTSFPLINTAAGTNFGQAWVGCSSLTSFPAIDTSSGTSFAYAWFNCTSLTDFPANFFDSWTGTPANNCFVNTWANCSALTATSVENILNSIDTSGQSAPASGVDIGISYNAGTGTPSVATAITNLKSRGWTITLNGVLQ